jgi:hypothetical protein
MSVWINKPAAAIPSWIEPHIAEPRAANGTFLIKSKPGQRRVHVGAAVFDHSGTLYTCDPSQVGEMRAELEQAASGWVHLPKGRETLDGEAARADRGDDTDEVSVRAAGGVPSLPPARLRPDDRFAPTKGMPPSIENRHPSELRIDDSYQRSIDTRPSQTLIERIARKWDWRMCLPLVVSKREDGSLYVIDGQHRLAAAQLRGDIPFLPCCVSVYGSVADEAAMFVAMNRARRQINRLDDFHAAQAGGDTEALTIARIVQSVGFTVSRKTGSATWVPGEVAFTSAIATVLRKHGEGIVSDVLGMMAEAFPDERLTAGASVFTSLARVLITPPDNFDRERLFRALLKFDMAGWASFLKGAKGGDDRAQKLREVLLIAYDEAVPEIAS